MLTSNPIEGLVGRLSPPVLDVLQATLDSLNGLGHIDAFEDSLVGSYVLNDEFGLPVDRKDEWLPGLREPFNELGRIPLEIGERECVLAKVDHDKILHNRIAFN